MVKVNLIIITARYFPYIGGAETQAERMAAALAARGHVVTVLTGYEEGMPYLEERDGVKVYRLPFLAWGVLAPLSLMFCSLLCIMFHWKKTDLLYACWPGSIFTGIVASLLTGIPLIAHFQEALPRRETGQPVLAQGISGKIVLWLMNRKISSCIAASQELAEELRAVGLTVPIHHLPAGVDTDRFLPVAPEDKIKLRRRLGLPERGVVLVYAGRWERAKGLDLLFAAWRRVRLSAASRCLLVIVGTGSLADKVFSRGARLKNCILLGPVDNVPDYLQAADILVRPSRVEGGVSLAVLEAMACGMAVVVTSVGGHTELICHQQNGILVPPDDLEQLINWLQTLMVDSGLRKELGEQARAKVETDNSLTEFVRRFESLCKQVHRQSA